MRRIAVCPGSFDPVTLGHLDIITRASKLFDKVIVLISRNAGKAQPSFTATERMLMIEQATKELDVVEERCKLKQALVKDKKNPNMCLLAAAQTRDKTAVTQEQLKGIHQTF